MESRTNSHEAGISSTSLTLACLQRRTLIEAYSSDHHYLIHGDILFLNMMMQGKVRNNGFGIEEDEVAYTTRLKKIATVLAELCDKNPKIKIISLCEGPINDHCQKFYNFLKTYPSLQRFLSHKQFIQTKMPGDPWGLLVLVDVAYEVKPMKVKEQFIKPLSPLLNNRLLPLCLQEKNNGTKRYFLLTHLPFAIIKSNTKNKFAEKLEDLSTAGQAAIKLIQIIIKQHDRQDLTVVGDLNCRPQLVVEHKSCPANFIPENNSIIRVPDEQSQALITRAVTVDAILRTTVAKQKWHAAQVEPDLSYQLMREWGLWSGRCHPERSEGSYKKFHDADKASHAGLFSAIEKDPSLCSGCVLCGVNFLPPRTLPFMLF